MKRPYYKKVDRSMMDWGLTLPQDYIIDFEGRSKLKPGTSRKIEILWGCTIPKLLPSRK